MNEYIETATTARTRHRRIAICGAIILLLSAGAALLPVIDPTAGAVIVGWLLLSAGMVEIYAGTLHWRAKGLAALAGVVTALAGLLLCLAYIDFGLTQVMFSHHLPSAFYALTVCTLAGLCLEQQRRSATAPASAPP